MRKSILWLGAIGLLSGQHPDTAQAPSPDAAWNELLAGNQRYVAGTPRYPHQSKSRRDELAKGQHPFAIILSCADSRVPPEIVFDQGLGDLFTVRVAGNVAPEDVVASLEYAVAHLGPKLIVVLGHERCGAVHATLKGGTPEGHLAALIDRIKPAVDSTKDQKGDALDNAVRANVQNVVKQLRSTGPILAEKIEDGSVKVVGARYDLDTGSVEVLP